MYAPPPRQVVQSLKSLTSVLSHCLSKWRRFGTSAQSSRPQLQLVCWITLHLAICLGKLLEAQGPLLTDVMLLQCMSATLVNLKCTLLNLTNIALQSEVLVRNILTDFSPSTDSSNCYSQCSSRPHDEWCNGSSLPTTTRNAPAIF